jgi:Mn2+/Fe2+ NRAMP family transporter
MKKLAILFSFFFLSTILLTGCSDVASGASALIVLFYLILKWGLILLVVGFVIALIAGLLNK